MNRDELQQMEQDIEEDLKDALAAVEELKRLKLWVRYELDRYPKMKRDGRQRKSVAIESIRQFLQERQHTAYSARQVAEHFRVSEVQMRNKLKKMAAQGTLTMHIPVGETAVHYGFHRPQEHSKVDYRGEEYPGKGPRKESAPVPNTGRKAHRLSLVEKG